MKSAPLAIAWEIWLRHRWEMILTAAAVGGMSAVNFFYFSHAAATRFAVACSYTILTAALFITFGCFHFTEGQRKAGFGSFPPRLFRMPLTTFWLVGLPMVYGLFGVLTTYLVATWLLFEPLGQSIPRLWPCLYLVSGFTIYQAILWSFPEHRYLKLFLLSAAAMLISFCWMFFLPHMIEGTLSDWGVRMSPQSFQFGLAAVLVAINPAAYLFSARQVARQRHGTARRRAGWMEIFERISELFFGRAKPLRSPEAALFWLECRQAGLVLPIAVLVVLGATCLPASFGASLSAKATSGLLAWFLVAPVILAAVIGRGFAKPDFWSPKLSLAPMISNLPITAGSFVFAKLKVALCSVLLTWFLVLYVVLLWMGHAGDPSDLFAFLHSMKIYYPGPERWILAGLAFFGWAALSWRLMVGGLWAGLSGRKTLYYGSNALTAIILLSLLASFIWTADGGGTRLHLYDVWGVIALLPILLGTIVIVRFIAAACAWNRVYQTGMISSRDLTAYFALWIAGTGLLIWGACVAFPHTPWLRHLLCLAAFLIFPLTSPAFAMLRWTSNRSGSSAKP